MKRRSNGKWPAHRQRIGLWGALGLALLLPNSPTALAAEHDVPLFMRASHDRQEGFVRIINRSDEDGAVRLRAFDDSGRAFDPVSLSLGAWQALHFNSDDLETGNAQKGITGTGSGTGNWRLKLESSLDIEVLAYVRTTDGFLSSMHDLVRKPSTNHLVPTFNPGDNQNQVSRLRLINPSANDAAVTVVGVDDQGSRTPPVSLTLSAKEARSITAQQLESGHSSLNGRLGDGNGKWRLFVSADAPIQVMSLLESPTGHLTNLSTSTSMRDYAPPPVGSPSAQIDIPDIHLRMSVERALGHRPGQEITEANMATLTDFNASGSGIFNLAGLEFATGLKSLVLSNNRISNLQPLAGLSRLTTLDLQQNNIRDIEALAGLTKLTNLNLDRNYVRDLAPLANLVNLTALSLNANEINDPTELAGLINLRELHVSQNEIFYISFALSSMIKLHTLDLTGNKVSLPADISRLADLPELTQLGLAGNNITNIPYLTFAKLSKLDLRDNPLSQEAETRVAALRGQGLSVDYSPPSVTTSVNIPDAKLRSAIERALGHYPGQKITETEMATLTDLSAHSYIVDLTGIQSATALKRLYLGNNRILDIEPLAGLTELTSLNLYGSLITDISALTALTKLTSLDLNFNAIEDINPLSGLSNLTILGLGHNQITDISVLANLTNLRELYIRDNNIKDISALANLHSLASLDIYKNGVRDISVLRGLKNLRSLDLVDAQITDISPLADLSALSKLQLNGIQPLDISLLAGLTNLEDLNLRLTNSTDISMLSRLTKLTRLNIDHNSIMDISPLANLTELTFLEMQCNPIKDFSVLAYLTKLETLDLQGTGIRKVGVLQGLTNLEQLYLGKIATCLSEEDIPDISALSGLSNLSYLSIEDANVGDISALAGMTKLVSLNLRGNNISDISPLAGKPHLGTLDLTDNEVSDISILENLPGLMWIRLANNEVTNIPDFSSVLHERLLELDLRNNPLSQEARNKVAMLRDSGVLVHYSPPVASTDQFPDSPLFQIYNDNVLVMEAAANLTVNKVGDGLALDAYAREFYKHFEDDFDFLLFLSNLDDHSEFNGDVYYGAYTSVMNDTEGTGLGIHFNNEFGSNRKLRGAIHFPYNRGLVEGPGLHELMHAWANFAIPSVEESHWGFSSANGQLGGFDLANLASLGNNRYSAGNFGTVANGGNGVPYSPIELYFAGYVPPESVPDLWVAADGAWAEETGVFTASEVREYSIEDIIAQHGQRVPNVSEAQWNYRAAVILLVSDDHPSSTAQLRQLSEQVTVFSSLDRDDSGRYNYREAVGNRGTITMHGLSRLRKPAPGAVLLPASFGKAPPPRFCWPDGRGGFMHKPLEKRVVLPLSGRGDLRHQPQRSVPVGG